MFNYDEDKYKANLRATSVPAALWEQLQEIEKYRESLRAAFLQLADTEEQRTQMLALIKEQERLTVQWHRMYLDATAGVEALKSTSIAEGLRRS